MLLHSETSAFIRRLHVEAIIIENQVQGLTLDAAILASSRSPVTMAGSAFKGIRIAVVVPPAGAAFVPVTNPVDSEYWLTDEDAPKKPCSSTITVLANSRA